MVCSCLRISPKILNTIIGDYGTLHILLCGVYLNMIDPAYIKHAYHNSYIYLLPFSYRHIAKTLNMTWIISERTRQSFSFNLIYSKNMVYMVKCLCICLCSPHIASQ